MVIVSSTDTTNFGQSLMHKLKGNLGAGILAMPATFAHCGLINGIIGLPILCILAAYCVHLLIKSSKHLENKMQIKNTDYPELAKASFRVGPNWMHSWSNGMCIVTDIILIVCQMGICCVYLVFVVDNLHAIIIQHRGLTYLSKYYVFLAIFPVVLWLSCVKTLKRLAIASTIANTLQVVGLLIIIQYLIREMPDEMHVNHHKPISEIALGFGSAIFAFEGISVVMPIYIRMKRPELMDSPCGVINVAFIILLVLNFLVGSLGYLKFGEQIRGSITLNLPKEPLYDLVRGMFTVSICLSYPLQIYVIAELLWKWVRSKVVVENNISCKTTNTTPIWEYIYECLCRTFLVVISFALAMTVPKLNLIMDLSGSISGTGLSIILPPLIHLATFWDDTSGFKKVALILSDGLIVIIGAMAGLTGTYFSATSIWQTFGDPFRDH